MLKMAPTYGKPPLYLTAERLVIHADVVGPDIEKLGPGIVRGRLVILGALRGRANLFDIGCRLEQGYGPYGQVVRRGEINRNSIRRLGTGARFRVARCIVRSVTPVPGLWEVPRIWRAEGRRQTSSSRFFNGIALGRSLPIQRAHGGSTGNRVKQDRNDAENQSERDKESEGQARGAGGAPLRAAGACVCCNWLWSGIVASRTGSTAQRSEADTRRIES